LSAVIVTAEDEELGARLRQARREGKLTLRDVAERTGLSQSFLSQVERGTANPSVGSLRRIAAGVDRPATWLLGGRPAAGGLVRRADRRRVVDTRRHWVDEFVTPPEARRLQVNMTVIEPGHVEPAYTHDSDEECVIVLAGRLELTAGDETYHLEIGDAVLIDPRKPHGFANPGPEPAEVLWVMSPPSY
jgi:transcriptional regulator with XRE-family HTH domain